METTSDFKLSKNFNFKIDLDNNKLDNAQYIMLLLMDKFKITNNNPVPDSKDKSSVKASDFNLGSLTSTSKALLNNVFVENLGIFLGSKSNAFGDFEFYINGIPKIFTPTGEMVVNFESFKKMLLKNQEDQLCFEDKAYIQIVNKRYPENYYGIFYTLADALKVCSENEYVKTGVVTS